MSLIFPQNVTIFFHGKATCLQSLQAQRQVLMTYLKPALAKANKLDPDKHMYNFILSAKASRNMHIKQLINGTNCKYTCFQSPR